MPEVTMLVMLVVLGLCLALWPCVPIVALFFNHSHFDIVLGQLDTLHLHLSDADSDASDNNFVQYLLQQQRCAIVINTVSNYAGHHFRKFKNFNELKRKLDTFTQLDDGVQLLAIDNVVPTFTPLLQLAQRLWEKHRLYKIYYLLQNATLCYYPFGRTNGYFGVMIDAHDVRLRNIFKNLNGYKLHVYMFQATYSKVYTDPRTRSVQRVTGVDSNVAQLLSKKMNFSMTYAWPDGEYFGARMKNGQFNGAIGRILRHEMDIVLTGFFVKDYLTRDISFSTAVYADELCCYVKKAARLPQYLLPFFVVDGNCWLCYFFVMGFSGVCWFCMRLVKNHISQWTFRISILKGFGLRVFADIWALWTCADIRHMPPHNSERFLVISVSLIGVIFGAICTSSLATLYIHPRYYRDINTWRKLDESNLPIYIKHPAFKDDLFYGHSSEVYRNLHTKLILVQESDSYLISSISIDGKYAGVTRRTSLMLHDINYIMTKKIHMGNECPKSYHIAYVLPKHSPYLDPIDLLLLRFKEAGLIDFWITQMKERAKLTMYHYEKYIAELDGEWKILILPDLQLAFFGLVFGYLIAAIVLWLEFIWQRRSVELKLCSCT